MKKVLMACLAMILMVSCQTKDSYLKDFNAFVEDVKAESAEYTEEDWQKVDDKFTKFSTELYTKFEEELSVEEKAEIVKLQAVYAGVKVKSGVKNAAKKVDKFLDGLKGSKK